MVYTFEQKIALDCSIKEETFMDIANSYIFSEHIETSIPKYTSRFHVEQKDGYVAINFDDFNGMTMKNIKELKLSIPSANFNADLSKTADVPKGHYFEDWKHTVVIKHHEILNPENKFFVDNVLKMEFRGLIECEKPEPESLGDTLWDAEDKDFTFIVEKKEIKAHKLILRQYSSVLSQMFNSNVKQLLINDFDLDTVRDALRFCYGLPPPYIPHYIPHYERLLNCLRFANVYDMPIIKERIAHPLSEYIDKKNVCELANKSLEYNAPELKGYCIDFISKCVRDDKTYDNAMNLNIEIVKELYQSSLCRTSIS
uniref:BTB domain-containing protein n=1 Tax=Panagrolaimus davidi TaxID=227884 RepID=A0A914PB83_9BILA